MAKIKYKPLGRSGFFDRENTTDKLKKLGNPLENLHKVIDFEMFRPELEAQMINHERKTKSGCRPYDVVLMFKIILLKRFYNLSDEQAEYQINDRQSFKNFLGLSSGDTVPDQKTIWLFQDNLIKKGLDKVLFEKFRSHLHSQNLFVNEGQIIDASFVETPIQRNSREENAKIKNGEGSELFNDNPKVKRQKDTDARWTQKGGKSYYGYKDHVKIDAKSKLINTYEVTDCSVHDSKVFDSLLRDEDEKQEIFADSAYLSEEREEMLVERNITSKISERAYKEKPLTCLQIESNRLKSQIRSRVEHVFGFITNSMNEFRIRSIGFRRARGIIGLINLVYNMCRYEQILRLKLLPTKG